MNILYESEYEKVVCDYFKEQGYEHLYGPNIHRKLDEILLEDDLRNFLNERYSSENLSEEIERIINKIKLIPSSPLYEGNRNTFYLVNEGFDLNRDDKNKKTVHIDYIDYDNPQNNIFKVVNQYKVKCTGHSEEGGIPDILIFVNGIPVAIWELKSVREETTIKHAWKQIHEQYIRDIPNLLKYCFISVISDVANTKMGSIFSPYEFYYSWNKIDDNDSTESKIGSLLTLIKGAFAKERLIAILRDFVFYPDRSENNDVRVCRYPQFFGANKMFASIKESVLSNGKKNGKGGTYSGATGCGKTMTMLFLTRLLIQRDCKTFNNPTIIIIVDRKDLDTQTSEQFEAAKKFLGDQEVESIESREDIKKTLSRQSGGVYITTIQKFCEETGLLSERSNIICISDEAHRTQTVNGLKIKNIGNGLEVSYGFAKYLRDSFPNATYCGFSGTPTDETHATFGNDVDKYTMKESVDDGITVKISYEPRLAKVILSDEKTKEIEEYYRQCAEEGSTEEQINASKVAMSKMEEILSHPDRIKKIAEDIVDHYETLCDDKPEIVQKAMIVCVNRKTAFMVLKAILAIRPDWGESRKSEKDLPEEKLDNLAAIPKINLVATQNPKDADPELFKACGTKDYRENLAKQFKNTDSNFKIAVVVDMWITGFDVPSLAVMYIDKPLQKHTLIQTISRVNRVFEGKDKGLVVDYIGFKEEMEKALKLFGGENESSVEDMKVTLDIFRNHLKMIEELLSGFDALKFFNGSAMEQFECLNYAVEFVQISKERQDSFMKLARTLKESYNICCHSGELSKLEENQAVFYIAVRSIIYKQTQDDVPDAEIMNKVVEEMIRRAIACTGVEDIVNSNSTKEIDIFSEEVMEVLKSIKLPITKFNALLKHLRMAIAEYGKTNRLKAIEFSKRLQEVVDQYNSRDSLTNNNEFIYKLSDTIIQYYYDLKKDKTSFEKMGISFEEKAFYDILISVRDEYQFEYSDEKCITLAQKIKKLVDDKSVYADWSIRIDIKSQLKVALIELLDSNDYLPKNNTNPQEKIRCLKLVNEIFDKVLMQAENLKKSCA